MAEDPYKVLGVAKDATDKQIRAAFHKVAKTSHPDLNPGDKKAEDRFKAATHAHDLLSDPERRAKFDRGEIDAAGQDAPPRGYYRDHAETKAGGRYRSSTPGGMFSEDELGDILSGMFRDGTRPGGGARPSMRGRDLRYTLAVSFIDGAQGGPQRLTLPEGGVIEVQIPPGTETGQVLRLRGKGAPGIGAGATAGDALIEIEVGPHPFFRREGRDIHLDLPVTVSEAVLGARVTVPTLAGPVTMAVPPGSDTGTRLRLRGRGIPAHGGAAAGDAFATLRVQIGPVDPALRSFLEDWTPTEPWNPRTEMEGG